MALNSNDYLQQLRALLPQGPAWPRDNDSLLTKVLTAVSEEFSRVDVRIENLLNEADPRTTVELLTDWERVAGLPDQCVANKTQVLGVGEYPVDALRLATYSRADSVATYYDADGVLRTASVDQPRYTHDPLTGLNKRLMIEAAATNLLTRSEEFDNAAWTKNATTITANAANAPDGTLAADKLVDSATNAFHFLRQDRASLPAGTYTQTCFIKAAELSLASFQFFCSSPSINSIVTFNLITGIATISSTNGLTNVAASMVNIGGGWYRCSVTFTFATNATTFQSRIAANNGNIYTGDGASGIYIWGAQLETGASATSYIKTAAAAVSRAADIATVFVEQTLQARRNALISKLTSSGGQSRAFFIALAEYLGFTITITEFKPFRAGMNCVGDPICGTDWWFAWRVNAPDTTSVFFRAGLSAAGEPLQDYGNELLECVFNRIKPAHTVLIFAYGG